MLQLYLCLIFILEDKKKKLIQTPFLDQYIMSVMTLFECVRSTMCIFLIMCVQLIWVGFDKLLKIFSTFDRLWQNTGQSVEQEFCISRLYWVEDSNQSVLNVCINVWYVNRTLKTVCSKKKMLFWMEYIVEGKPCINRESNALEPTA